MLGLMMHRLSAPTGESALLPAEPTRPALLALPPVTPPLLALPPANLDDNNQAICA
jgi:hypothetical protein